MLRRVAPSRETARVAKGRSMLSLHEDQMTAPQDEDGALQVPESIARKQRPFLEKRIQVSPYKIKVRLSLIVGYLPGGSLAKEQPLCERSDVEKATTCTDVGKQEARQHLQLAGGSIRRGKPQQPTGVLW